MLVGFDELVRSLEERDLYIINLSSFSQHIILPYLELYSEKKGKEIIKYFHSMLPFWDKEKIKKIVDKDGAVLIGIHFINRTRERDEIEKKFEECRRDGKILLVSDTISINSINHVHGNGFYQYLANKRVLKNSPSMHYSHVESVVRALEELFDVDKVKNIKIKEREIDSRIGLALGHYWDNQDKSNPEFEHNKFLREKVEGLNIKNYDLNLEKRIKDDLRVLNNFGICLNFSPEEVKSPNKALKEAREELKTNDKFAKNFLSPLFGDETFCMMVNDFFGNIYTLERNLEENIRLGNLAFETWKKEIFGQKNLIESLYGISVSKFECKEWELYSIGTDKDPIKLLNLTIMLPNYSCLVVFNPHYNGKTSFALATKPYEYENEGIPPAFLASLGSARLYKSRDKILAGVGDGDVSKGYVLVQEENVPPKGFLFPILALQEKANGIISLSYKLTHKAWYENKIAVGCVHKPDGYLIEVAIPPTLVKEIGKSFLVIEDLERMGLIKTVKVDRYSNIPKDRIKESLGSVVRYFSKYGESITISDDLSD
jgi:hypothetical protein